MPQSHFFLKLNPPRPTFPGDITPEEMTVMKEHQIYWKGWMDKGVSLVYGPVFMPNGGGYGIGVVEVDSMEIVKDLVANDPVTKAGLGTYEYYPMRAILPAKT